MEQPKPNSERTPFWQLTNDETPKNLSLEVEDRVRQAFGQSVDVGIALLFRLYYTPLCSHALRFVSSKAIAEDLVSDIFYEFHSQQLYKKIDTSFRAYLFTTIRHRCFDYVRREMQRKTALENAASVSANEAQHPASITQYEELYQDIQNAINAMPIKRRQIYLMNRFDGKRSHEIAEELAVSSRTVEAHLYQALKQLRDTLRDKWS